MTNNEQDYDICFRADNVVLPKHGYFGISAATGMHKNIDIYVYARNCIARFYFSLPRWPG